MRTRMALALAAGVLVGLGGAAQAAGPVGIASGFPYGWTTVLAEKCVVNHNNLLLIYPAGHPTWSLQTQNASWVGPLSILCREGKTFGVYIGEQPNKWLAVSYIPDSK